MTIDPHALSFLTSTVLEMHYIGMLLADYLKTTKTTDAAFAAMIGVGRPMVTRLRHRKVKPSFDTALKIEQATHGRVLLSDLQTAMIAEAAE